MVLPTEKRDHESLRSYREALRSVESPAMETAMLNEHTRNLSQMKAVLSDFEERPAEVLHLIADGLRAKAKELERREPEPDGSEKLAHFAH